MSYLDIIMALLFFAFFVCSRQIGNYTIFGRDSTDSLRGLAMLGIILHHIHNRLGLCSPIISQVGYLATGLFFFISGYGNMLSINKKNDINVKWFVRKLLKIYVPFFVAYWFYYICNIIFYPCEVPTIKEMIQDIITISLPNEISWFPKIIVLCFLIHYLTRKAFSNRIIQLATISMVICVYIVIMWKKGTGSYWYNSVLCYPFGIFVSLVKDSFLSSSILEKRKLSYLYV